MQSRQWMHSLICLMLIRSLVLSAFAAEPIPSSNAGGAPSASVLSHNRAGYRGAGRGFTGFQRRLEHALGLTPEQREAVHGLLAQQHEQLQALRETMEPKYRDIQEQTDARIRALLNAE